MSNSGFFVDVSGRAIVSLKGSESLDLLHRISTNDVQNVPLNGAIQTVFTNEKGRIVEVASILNRGEEEVLVVGQGTDSTLLKDWIERFVIMEEIEVGALSDSLIHFMLFELINTLERQDLGSINSEALMFVETLRSSNLTHIIAPRPCRATLEASLTEAGIQKCGYQVYDEHRILHGIPGFPGELSTSFNPLEAGLVSLVSFTKGCYVGQEVIARLDTYKKVQKRLVRFALDAMPLMLPETVLRQGQEWGTITSAKELTPHGCRGIGYVKTGSDELLDNLCFRLGTEEIKIEVEAGTFP